MIKVLVNATPCQKIQTGIGRYVRLLYEEVDRLQLAEVWYSGNLGITKELPSAARRGYSNWFNPKIRMVARRTSIMVQDYRAASFVKKERINAYHETAMFPPLTLGRIPVVQTIYDLSLITHKEFHPKDRVEVFKKNFRKRFGVINQYIAISEYIKKQMVEILNLDSSSIKVIHLAPNKVFQPADISESRNWLSNHNIQRPYILTVSTIEPRKNLLLALEALKYLPEDIILVCVGWKGWGNNKFESMVDQLKLRNRVVTTGYVTDKELSMLYSNAEALVYPSVYEGFGLPALEAMKCGCPVICSNSSSLPEICDNAAVYIDPFDYASATMIIKDFILSERARNKKIEEGFKQASKYSWSKTAKQTVGLMEELC